MRSTIDFKAPSPCPCSQRTPLSSVPFGTVTHYGPCDGDPETLGTRGAFQPQDTNTMADFTYMPDHMGNIVGMVDCEQDIAKGQVSDAFGNNVGGHMMFRCASDCDYADAPFHQETEIDGGGASEACPPLAAQPIERMQTRMFNWRGNEGSLTDMLHEDIADARTFEDGDPDNDAQRWPAYTRPSTGLIYMQARYYEPETGRFTQADPLPYDIGQLINGQNNRWVYCGNDPVNLTDPSGEHPLVVIAVILFAIAFGFGFYASTQSCSVPWAIVAGATAGTLGSAFIESLLVAGGLFDIVGAAAVSLFPVVGILIAALAIGFVLGFLAGAIATMLQRIAYYAVDAIYDSIATYGV